MTQKTHNITAEYMYMYIRTNKLHVWHYTNILSLEAISHLTGNQADRYLGHNHHTVGEEYHTEAMTCNDMTNEVM